MGFSDALRRAGAVFGPWRGRSLALHFGHWHAEYAAFDNAACVFDAGPRTYVEVLGADRLAFIHRMCTNQVAGRPAGSGCEAFFLDAKGRTLSYVHIFVGPESLLLETAAGQSEPLLTHLGGYVVRDRVEFYDRSRDWHPLRVGGRGAKGLLEQLLGSQLPDQPLAHGRGQVAGLEVWVMCLRSEGRPCWQIIVPRESGEQLWCSLRDDGAAPCGCLAAEAVRIEYGEPEYGVDITAENLPQEVGRDAAISTAKGCYLGQEVVARIDSRGHVNRRLVGLVFSDPQVPAAPAELYAAGQRIGHVTSASFSPGLGKAVGLGYVRRGYWQPGQRLECSGVMAEVASLPLRP